MEKRNKITTGKQFEILISELEKKPSLARRIHRGTTLINSFRQDWEEITIKLNAHGPPLRDCDGWLRVWRDFKFKLRKKLLHKQAQRNGIAEGKAKNIIIFPLEKAAAKLIFSDNHDDDNSPVDFQPAVCEIKSESLDEAQTTWEEEDGFQSENQSLVEEVKTEENSRLDQTLLDDDEYFPSTSANSYHIQMLPSPERNKRKRNRKCDQRQELLEKHNRMQEKSLYEISNNLKELENIFRGCSRYQQKMLEVQEKKLQIIQRQHAREEQLFKSEMKLKLMEMKIKTKELDALDKQSTS